MALQFASRMDRVEGSVIRELLKLAEKPEIISFAGGFPAPEFFPVEEMKKVCTSVLEKEGQKALQYGATEPLPALREHIANIMSIQGIKADPDTILATSGSQQGLEFSAKLFINPGDVIITESPTYLGALNAFKSYEPKFVDVEMDENGMIPEALEAALENTENVKFIYTIPDFQNPTGITMSVERRKKVVELANKYNVAIVEDNPYGALRYEGEILPAIKTFDTEGRVIYLGTMSKIFCPGLRLGWVYAQADVLKKYNLIKQCNDLQVNSMTQRECIEYFNTNDIREHIAEIVKVYGQKKNLMVETIKKEFPASVTYTNPQGGLFLWVTLPENVDASAVFEKALQKNVAFVIGQPFYSIGDHKNHFRLNYSYQSVEEIVEGITRLGQVLKEFC